MVSATAPVAATSPSAPSVYSFFLLIISCKRSTASAEILLALLQNEYHLPGESAEIRALDIIVQRCLAKDPRDRYGSSAELAKDLVPALARCAGFGGPHDVTLPDARTL